MPDLIAVVTQAWLIAMAKDGFPIEPLIDPEQGLVILDHMVDSPAEDNVGEMRAKRLCGDELAKALPQLRKDLTRGFKHADAMDCHNKPGPPFCRYFYAYEYTVSGNLVMRRSDDGHLMLDAIMGLDGGSMVPQAYAEQSKWVAKQMTKLRSTNCAGVAQTPPSYKHVANPF
jgi:hypothetical protein